MISPLDAALYLIAIDDGTVYMSLPNAIKKKLAPVMRPEYSLIRERVNILPVPRSLLPKSPNQTSAATARPRKADATLLRPMLKARERLPSTPAIRPVQILANLAIGSIPILHELVDTP